MKMNINYNFFTIGILTTLAVYHLLIYIGRARFKVEKYYLYFSIFLLSIVIYIFINTSLFISFSHYLFNLPLMNSQNLIESLCALTMIFSGVNFLCILLNYPHKKIFNINYLFVLSAIMISLMAFWLEGINTKWFISLVYTINFLELTVVFCVWIIKKKLYKQKQIQIISSGLLIIISYIILEKTLIILIGDNFLSRNFFFFSISAIVFSFALAINFNHDFKELFSLKNRLEILVQERTRDLEIVNRKLEKSMKRQSQFFINLAHETKTPLTLIGNYLDLYLKKHGTTKELRVIKDNILKLIRDMVNFLDTQKLESGKMDFDHSQAADLSQLIRDKVELLDGIAKNNNLNIHHQVMDDLYIKADPDAITRIIDNVFFNAVKFNQRGGEIEIILKKQNEKIVFIVSNTGYGIEGEELGRVFEPYSQMTKTQKGNQGIGIGLYLVKKIVENLNGSIKIESEINKKTSIYIEFQYEPESKGTTGDEKNISEKQELNIYPAMEFPILNDNLNKEKPFNERLSTVLIVEDNPDLLSYLISELGQDYNVLPADNGQSALTKIRTNRKPDLVLSDIMMDNMDGYELLSALQTDDDLKDIPVVFLTARSDENEITEGIRRGAVDYITKPFSVNQLKAKIDTLIQYNRKKRAASFNEAIKALTNQLNKNISAEDRNLQEFLAKCEKNQITKRQKEIIMLLKEGYEYKEIAYKLNLSFHTVNRHIQNLFEKLSMHNKAELLNYFFFSDWSYIDLE